MKAIVLHDLTYNDELLETFFSFLSKTYELSTLSSPSVSSSAKPNLLITADDGYADWQTLAYYAERFDFRIMAGVVTGFIDKNQDKYFREFIFKRHLHRTKPNVYPLDPNIFEKLIETGRFVFVDHTYSHVDLGVCDPDKFREELYKSKEVLTSYGLNTTDFFIPYGRYNNFPSTWSIQSCTNEIGIERIWSFLPRCSNKDFFPRIGIDPSMGKLEIIARILRGKGFDAKHVFFLDLCLLIGKF